jgi:hypothetical protein
MTRRRCVLAQGPGAGHGGSSGPGPHEYEVAAGLRTRPAFSMGCRLGSPGKRPGLGGPGPGAYEHECSC